MAGKNYADHTVVCEDLNDGDISSRVQVLGGEVDLSVPGTYHIKYECKNSHGVAAAPKYRTVEVTWIKTVQVITEI